MQITMRCLLSESKPALRFTGSITLIVYDFSGKNQKATNTYIKQLPLNWKRQTQVKQCKCT